MQDEIDVDSKDKSTLKNYIQNDSMLDSKSMFGDYSQKQKQYHEDQRDYYNIYNKKHSFLENDAEDMRLNLNIEANSSFTSSTHVKQLNLIKSHFKISSRDAKSPQSKQSIRLMKGLNRSYTIDKDNESTPKNKPNDNVESGFKLYIPSNFDSNDSSKTQNQKFGFKNSNDQIQNINELNKEANDDENRDESNSDNPEAQDEGYTVDGYPNSSKKHCKPSIQITKKSNNLQKALLNFNKLNFIKKFVKKMTGLSPQYNFRRLKEFHFEVIGDMIQIISYQFFKQRKGQSLFILRPNERFSLVWEIFEIIFLFFHVIAFGFRFAFNIPLNYYVQLFSIIFFLLDLFVIMNTGYYSGIEIVTNRFKIIKFNLFNIFMIIVSLGALILSESGTVQFVFIFRIKQLYRSYNHFEQNFQIKQKHPVSATLVRLFLIIILLAHYNACGFYFFTKNFNSSSEQNWLSFYGIENSAWQNQYITTLYFSFITMVTVGYGDVVPKTMNERVYIIFFVLISAITFAYVVNTIGSLFQELSRQEGKFNQKKYEIMNYMQERNISKSIQISVVKFLEYTIKQEKELQYSLAGESFLQSIPIKLRQQVYQEYYGRILHEIKLFSMNFSQDFLQQLSVLMKEKTYGPGEEIVKQGDKNNTFFFINKGIIEFDVELYGKNIINVGTLKKGDSFNHKGLFIDHEHEITARCKQITQIIYLNQEDFQRVLKQNKDEYEKFCMMKDKFFQDSFSLGEKCLSCQEYNHSVLKCNLIKYSPGRGNLIAKDQFSLPILIRLPYEKRRIKKYNSIINNFEIKQSLRILRIELTFMLLGQKFGSFSELAERNFSDEQFFKFFPKLQQNTERYIFISSQQDLNRSLESEDDQYISTNNNNNNNNNINGSIQYTFNRETGMHDTFQVKTGKQKSYEQPSLSSAFQQSSQRLPSPSLSSSPPIDDHIVTVLSPAKNQFPNTEDNTSVDHDSESEQASKHDSSVPNFKQDGFQKMTSLKIYKEPNSLPASQKLPNSRRYSTLGASQNNIQHFQYQNVPSFQNLLNQNQLQSHNEQGFQQNLSSITELQSSQHTNQILNTIINQLQQVLSANNIQHHVANFGQGGGGGGVGLGGGVLSSYGLPKNKSINMRSLTNVYKEPNSNNINNNNNNNNNNTVCNILSATRINVPIEQNKINSNDSFYLQHDFDLMREYKYYFPSMNFVGVKIIFNLFQENKSLKKAHQSNLSPLKKTDNIE